jgi:hypothetical protein
MLEFGTFRIQKFSKRELDELIDQDTRETFYPDARLNTDLASDYWFVVEKSTTDHGLSVMGKHAGLPFAPMEVKRKLPDRVIQLLALHEWTPKWIQEDWTGDERFWMGFTVPFSFTVNDDVFERPRFIPPLPNLDRVPDEIEGGDGPEFPIVVDRKDEARLRSLVEKGQKAFGIIDQINPLWNFVEIAMGYLAKAFLTADDLDQLLWHVAALDALISEENTGVRQVMRPRIGAILGTDASIKKKILRQFDELYAFRSSLVHGKSYTTKAEFHHLAEARDLAKEVLLWFLDYLIWIDTDLSGRGITHDRYPKRMELLTVLDLEKAALDRISLFTQNLPSNFPRLNAGDTVRSNGSTEPC